MHRLAALLALFVALPAFADARAQFDRFIEETRSFTADFARTSHGLNSWNRNTAATAIQTGR